MNKIIKNEFQTIKDILDGEIKYYVSDYEIFEISKFNDEVSLEIRLENGIVQNAVVASNGRDFFKTEEEAKDSLIKGIKKEIERMVVQIQNEKYYNFLRDDIIKAAKKYGLEVDKDIEDCYYYFRKSEIERQITTLLFQKDRESKEIEKLTNELKNINNIEHPLDI